MPTPQVVFRYGENIQTMDYTPGADVNAGDVVLVGQVVGIAVVDIPNGKLGALNIYGGVYSATGDAAITIGKNVYWDNTNDKVSETATGNKFFGVTVSACSGNNATCDVAHLPAPTVPPGSGG